jgi:hypothetical protein
MGGLCAVVLRGRAPMYPIRCSLSVCLLCYPHCLFRRRKVQNERNYVECRCVALPGVVQCLGFGGGGGLRGWGRGEGEGE